MSTAFEKIDSLPDIPSSDIIDNMTEYAIDYSKNHNTNEDDFNIDLVLTDSMNYIGRDLNYRVHNSELRVPEKKYARKTINKINPNTLLNILLTKYQAYFDEGIIPSIESQSEYYDMSDEILDEDSSVEILVDYLNYIAKKNSIETEFTVTDITRIKHKKRCLTISPRLGNK